MIVSFMLHVHIAVCLQCIKFELEFYHPVKYISDKLKYFNMKPTLVADEMFPEGAGPYVELDEVGGSRLLVDLTASEKAVHADFFNEKFFYNNNYLTDNKNLQNTTHSKSLPTNKPDILLHNKSDILLHNTIKNEDLLLKKLEILKKIMKNAVHSDCNLMDFDDLFDDDDLD